MVSSQRLFQPQVAPTRHRAHRAGRGQPEHKGDEKRIEEGRACYHTLLPS